MKRTALLLGAALMALAPPALAQNRTTLDIYVIDVEGGNATLFVPPSGESVLMDTGNVAPAAAKRDADRIMQAVKDAGLTRIDHLITTHWHGDHFGGMAELAAQIPILEYIDHGPNVQPAQVVDDFLTKTYPGLYGKSKRTIAKPGDRLQVAGLDWRIVASAGQTQTASLPGAGRANPYCAGHTPGEDDPTENAQSVSSIISFGRFRVAHLGDLTWNKEFNLMCPVNRVGTVDLFVVSHHGQPISNAPVLVHAMAPRVGILNNGTRKGGQPPAMQVIASSPGIEDLWQIHFSLLSGQEYTQAGMFIANGVDEAQAAMPVQPIAAPPPGPNAPPPPQHNGPAFWFKVQAKQDGSFTVTNQRNGFTKTYAAR
ncbi:MAG: MBL fold metallo-hydrolase [Alphaproteobacteria bacterium]|nr:MBL fold metallo-hydrolase [Alphaproteobacteria bacterium]